MLYYSVNAVLFKVECVYMFYLFVSVCAAFVSGLSRVYVNVMSVYVVFTYLPTAVYTVSKQFLKCSLLEVSN